MEIELSRWRERPRGLLYRLKILIARGLQQELRTRFFRWLLFSAIASGAAITLMGFVFSQAMASGGWFETWAANFGPRGRALYTIFTGFSALYPELGIGGFFTLVFWLHSRIALILCLLALTAMVPRLLSSDRSTNALVLYFSRPLTSTDYLLGKFGLILSTLGLLWTAPMVLGWLLSLAFAPDRDFVIYGFAALKRALLFNGIAMGSLAFIALGVSAASRTARHTSLLWIALWLILGTVANSRTTRNSEWLRRISFTHNLSEVRQGIFELDRIFTLTADNLPLLSETKNFELKRFGSRFEAKEFRAALVSLAVMSALSSVVLFRKLRSS